MIGKSLRWGLIVFLMVVTVVPLLWLLMSSIKTEQELFNSPFSLPRSWSLANYFAVISDQPIFLYLRNSIIASLGATTVILAASLLASYALLHQFRLNKTVFLVLIFGILLPTNALITPIFLAFIKIGLYNSLLGLVLVYSGMFFPIGFLVVKGYVDSIPREIIDAGRSDGAGFHQVFRHIVVPLSVPGAATAGIFVMISAWNELFYALILTQDSSSQTVQVGMRYFLTTYNADYPLAFAFTVMSMIPTILVFVILSDRVIQAMTLGSLK
jgi:raffinose/stachyose/melibiose transport system permease protein